MYFKKTLEMKQKYLAHYEKLLPVKSSENQEFSLVMPSQLQFLTLFISTNILLYTNQDFNSFF
jgi:hypothetical protein